MNNNTECVVGVPRERKKDEGRVGMTPAGVAKAVRAGAIVLVERDAGVLSGFSDSAYANVGAIVTAAEEVWGKSDIVVKVKEPIREEYQHLLAMRGKTLFTYLHLAGSEIELTRNLLRNEITAIAYETVAITGENGRTVYPLLVPMSKIAGTQAMRGAIAHHKDVRPRNLSAVIIGGGNVGEAALVRAIKEKVGFVLVYEAWDPRVRELREEYHEFADCVKIFSLEKLDDAISKKILGDADIVISAPMLPGGKEAPIVLTQKHFRIMKKGAYIADVAIDQGGSTAWTKGNPTKPGETFTRGAKKLVFSAVQNIPGSTVPAEATKALTDATLPYLLNMVRARLNFSVRSDAQVLPDDQALWLGVQTRSGKLRNRAVAELHGLLDEYSEFGM